MCSRGNGCFKRVSGWFEKCFNSLGEFIGTYPKILISISLVVSIGLGVGMMTFTNETSTEALYTPVGSIASKDREKYQSTFPEKSGSNYFVHTLTEMDVFAEIIFESKNVIESTTLSEIHSHMNMIKNINISFEGSRYTYQDVCARLMTECYNSANFSTHPYFISNATVSTITFPMWDSRNISSVFGGVTVNGGVMTSARYLRVTFPLRQDTDTNKILSAAWEDEFLEVMSGVTGSDVTMVYATSQSIDKELSNNTQGDVTFFSITFTLMITYATIVAGGNMLSSRTWASCAGVVAAGMGVVSAFGLVSLCGVKFVNIVGVTPFLIIGIGVDDMFLLMSSWTDTYSEERTGVKQRMGATFSTAGIGITITSITDLLAFAIGASSVFRSVRNFCLYTGVAVIFTYIYQCFLFGPCLALHGLRVDAERHCITCRKVQTPEQLEGRNGCYIFCCSGSRPTKTGDDARCCESLPPLLIKKIVGSITGKVFIIFLFLAYIAVSVWGVLNLKQGLDLKNLVSKSSYYYSYRETLDNNLDSSFPIPFVFEASTDYRDPEIVAKIDALLNATMADERVNGERKFCWLFEYMKSSDYNSGFFVGGLPRFLDKNVLFQNDVEFSSDATSIIASRCYLFSNNIKDSNIQADTMDMARQRAEDSGLPVYVFYPAFIFFEQYLAILPSTLQTVGIAMGVMTVVTFLFLPDICMVLLVVLNIFSILVGIFGFFYIWDLSLSSVTMIHLIMSVGFSVDFSVHVCSAYLLSKRNKTESAIEHAASPIFNGALSSFLGIIVLVFSQSYIFQSFFKVMFTVLLLGIFHAVFVLPVILSLLERKSSCSASTGDLDNELSKTNRNGRHDIALTI